jgi:hypothetical protein
MNNNRIGLRRVSPAVKALNELRRQNAIAFALKLKPTLDQLSEQRLTQRQMVEELNRLGFRTAEGAQWTLSLLQRVLGRLK